MPDGSLWGVSAGIVARDRAAFYDKKEPGSYEHELMYTLGDDYELTDWLANNMSWKMVSAHAVKLASQDPVDYEEGICNGEKEVIR